MMKDAKHYIDHALETFNKDLDKFYATMEEFRKGRQELNMAILSFRVQMAELADKLDKREQ